MIIQCVIRLFGIWTVCETQWEDYRFRRDDKEWLAYYRTWMQPWCRYLCTYQLVKKI